MNGSQSPLAWRSLVAALTVAGVAAVAGCGSSDNNASTATDTSGASTTAGQKITVALDNGAGANYPWTQALERGIRAQAKQMGNVDIVANLDGKSDVQTEANNVQAIIAQKPDGVLMYTGNGAQAPRLVDQLTNAGIKVVAVHYRVGSNADVADVNYMYPKLAGQVIVDEGKAGELAGDLVKKVAPDGGDVAVATGIPGYVEVGQRLDGFKKSLSSDSRFKIVATQPGNYSPQDAEKACAGMLNAHPSLVAIYVQADIMAPGCAKAVKAAGSEAKIVGMGGSKQGINLLRAGQMAATICYRPFDEGKAAVELLGKTLATDDGAAKPESVVLPTPPVSADDLSSCVPQYDN